MFSKIRGKIKGKIARKTIVTATLMIVVFVMSLGYAALSQYMEIEGMAIVQKLWNVYVLDVTVANTNSGSGIGKFETTQNVVSLSTTLPNLNSTVTYTITFKNSGNVKGKLYSIDQIEDKNTNITYSISGITIGSTIAASGTATATVTVQYKQGVTSISTEPKKMMLQFNFVEDTSSSGGSSDSGGSSTVTLSSKILSDNTAQSDSNIDFSAISSDTNGKGLYYTSTNTEDNKTTYYFRGNVTNNNVQFGTDSNGNKLYWKIIRINEDGSIRLIHNGTTTGQGDEMIDNGFGPFNINTDDNAYVGYMHGYPKANTLTYPSCVVYNAAGEWETSTNSSTCSAMGATLLYSSYEATHANVKDSDIKAVLDNWYTNNLSSYSSYLADAGFCNDRSVESSEVESSETGVGSDSTTYGSAYRIETGIAFYGPQFKCPQTNDLFTTSTSTKGNKALTYPIGLITVDEVAYAGGTTRGGNSSYYLYATEGSAGIGDGFGEFWTMSPSGMYSDVIIGGNDYYAEMYIAGHDGTIYSDVSYNLAGGVRPVINLKSTVTLSSTNPSGCSSQNGSDSCPYVIYTGSSSGTTTSYTVSVTSTNTSYGTVSPSSTTVASGSSATFTLSPKSGYAYSSNTCGGTVSGNTMTISNVTANKTCTVTFKQSSTGTTLASKILADNTVQSDSEIDFSNVNSATNGQGLYRTTQDPLRLGDSYYFRGDSTLNNFVKFGKYPANTTINGVTYTTSKDIYWRIIRINEDGNIRLLYAGVDPNSTSDDLIGTGPFNANTAFIGNDNLRYNYGALTSDLKYALDNWYSSYMISYASYIGDSTFCNDMAISSGSGVEEEYTEYAAFNRLQGLGGIVIPTYSCNENSVLAQESSYTVANGNLTYPVGTVTADELVYAGAPFYGGTSNSPYFIVDTNFWTMTPMYFSWAMAGPGVASYVNMYDDSGLSWTGLTEDNAAEMSLGYRPVINLKSTVTLSGTNPSGCSSQNGSASCPYVIG